MYGHVGCNVMTQQCHVTNLIIMNMINLDLPYLNGVKFAIENIAKSVFFGRFLGYLIGQWSHVNAPHTNLTMNFLESVFVTSVGQLVILDTVALIYSQYQVSETYRFLTHFFPICAIPLIAQDRFISRQCSSFLFITCSLTYTSRSEENTLSHKSAVVVIFIV